MNSFVKGQTVFFTHPLLFRGQGLVIGYVEKVGKKYVYVKRVGSTKIFRFHISTLIEADESNYKGKLYLSESEYRNEVELSNNHYRIKRFISNRLNELTLEDTRKILDIIGKYQ